MKKFLNRVVIAASLALCAVASSVAAESYEHSMLMISAHAQSTDADKNASVEFANHSEVAVVNTVTVSGVKEAERLYNVSSDAYLNNHSAIESNVIVLNKQRAWLDYTERHQSLVA